jgi:hypothetical protein
MILGSTWSSSDGTGQFNVPKSSREVEATAKGTPVSSLSVLTFTVRWRQQAGGGGATSLSEFTKPLSVSSCKGKPCVLLQGGGGEGRGRSTQALIPRQSRLPKKEAFEAAVKLTQAWHGCHSPAEQAPGTATGNKGAFHPWPHLPLSPSPSYS